jgi:uncharacterized protein YkwD
MLKLTRRGFIVLFAASGLAACSGDYVPTTVTPAVDVTPAEMLAGINAVRAQNGSKPLVLSPSLTAMARAQASAMVSHDQMSHDFGLGQDLRSRATLAGYHGPVGENVAAGQTTLEETLKDWMNSAGHRATLLSGMWTSVGMVVQSARAGSRYGVYWAADFGTS